MSDILDTVSDTLKQGVDLWGQVQQIKLDTMITKAQLSAMSAGAPNAYSNPQAKAGEGTQVPGVGTLSGTGMLLAFAAFGVAVYLAVK